MSTNCPRTESVIQAKAPRRRIAGISDLWEGLDCYRYIASWGSLAAYERTWRTFLAWAAAASFDSRSLSFPKALEAYRFLGDGKNAASLKQIRAALSFAYKP